MNTKATLYLDEKVYRALKVKAALSDQTVSETANTLISRGLAADARPAPRPNTVTLVSEGTMGYPVLTLEHWPDGYIFDRDDIYD